MEKSIAFGWTILRDILSQYLLYKKNLRIRPKLHVANYNLRFNNSLEAIAKIVS